MSWRIEFKDLGYTELPPLEKEENNSNMSLQNTTRSAFANIAKNFCSSRAVQKITFTLSCAFLASSLIVPVASQVFGPSEFPQNSETCPELDKDSFCAAVCSVIHTPKDITGRQPFSIPDWQSCKAVCVNDWNQLDVTVW